MSAQGPAQSSPSPSSSSDSPVDILLAFLLQFWTNFSTNLAGMFRMTPFQLIRLIAIVGGYILIRPWLVKLGMKIQESSHNREIDPDELKGKKGFKKTGANVLRGGKGVVGLDGAEESDDDEDAEGKGKSTGGAPEWGRSARKRQKQALKAAMEEREKQDEWDDWSDPDVSDLLDVGTGDDRGVQT